MRLILFSVLQSLLLCSGQMFLKMATKTMGTFSWTWSFWGGQFLNKWWYPCLFAFVSSGVMWIYIIKKWPFSQAYPLSSLAYVFGMIAAMMFFNEHIAWTQWVGVLFIMAGCYLVVN